MKKNSLKEKIAITVMSLTMAMTSFGSLSVYAAEDIALEDAILSTQEQEASEEEKKAEAEVEAQAESEGEAPAEGELNEETFTQLVSQIEEVGNSYKKGDKVPEDDVITAVDAVYQAAIVMKDSGAVTKVNKRTSNVEITFANGQIYTWEAGNEPSEEAIEKQKENEGKVLQEVTEQPIQSNEEKTRWEPQDSENKTQKFLTPVPSTTTRYEIFYTAGTEIPTVTFTSATGKYTLTAGQDVVTDGENGFKFITRSTMVIDGHDDFRFMTIYISGTDDPGKWVMEVTAPSSVIEVIAVSSAVPDDWETVNSDVVTKPYGIVFWYVDSKRSQYRETPVALVNELMSAKTSQAPVDKITKTDPEEPDYTNAYIAVTAIAILLVIAFTVFLLVRSNKKKTAVYRAKREAIVKKENAKVAKKKSKQNDELDDFLDDFSDEYIDDGDMSDYLNVDDTDGNDGVFTEEDMGVMTDDDAEYEASLRAKEKMNDNIAPAPWMETESVVPVKYESKPPVQKNNVSEEVPVQQKTQNDFTPVSEPAPIGPSFVSELTPASAAATSETVPAWLSGISDDDGGDFF